MRSAADSPRLQFDDEILRPNVASGFICKSHEYAEVRAKHRFSQPMSLRDYLSSKARKAQFEIRRLRDAPRAQPDFIVIGAQKSGTSSMFAYLRQHPQILRPIYKEPYFFDRHYHRGLAWYGCNFPTRAAIERRNDLHQRRHLTFEATATYVFEPGVPERIRRDLGTRKFILLLRNPADRAISAYWHARRMGRETRSLEDALAADFRRYEQDLAFEERRAPAPEGPAPRPAYLRRGIYHEAVARWQKIFSPQELLVLQSEKMFREPKATMAEVFEFLNLPFAEHIDFTPQNVGGYDGKDTTARNMLREFYSPHNRKLDLLCGKSFEW